MDQVNSSKDLITVWQRYTLIFEEMFESEPLLLPLVRQWVNTSDLTTLYILYKGLKKATGKIFHLIKSSQSERVPNFPLSKPEICDILFLPGFARINCLGPVQLVAQSLWSKQQNYKAAIIPPVGNGEANLPLLDERFIKYSFVEVKLPSPHSLWSVWSLFVQVKEKISSDPILLSFWRKKWHLMLFDIARFYQNMQQSKELLLETECRLVVCLNEQSWPGSAFIPAAKELGIPTVQVMHGTPTKLYWPFISDETWVWDELTFAMFESYGAPASRLYITGNIESVFWLNKSHIYGRNKQSENDLKTCLFLSQWSGTETWGVSGFDEPVDWLAEALSKQDGQWRVIVRLHPYDGENAREGIREKLGFLATRLIFSDSKTLLIEDIVNADMVCTGSSTALLMATTFNKPSFLLWTPVMEYVHGNAYLPEECVLRSRQELVDVMLNIDNVSHKSCLHSDYKDAADIASERILQLGG